MPKRVAEMKVKQVEALKAPGLYAVGGAVGLHLQISERSARSWTYRYQINGKRRDMGLGGTDLYNLAQARERAREARRLVDQGVDPIDQRRAGKQAAMLAAAKSITFEQAAKAYIKAQSAGWRNSRHAAQWPQSLEAYVFPVFGNLSVQAVDVTLVMKAIEPIWTEKPETASRVRGRIESVLDWATARGYRKGENPARWRGHLENLLPARSKVRRVVHHPALPYAEMSGFMTQLRALDGVACRCLEFAILTCARSGEAIGARWSEIDLAARLWTIPAERMKGGREHRVPLSDAAVAVVEQMAAIRHSDFVFPGMREGRPLSPMSLVMTLPRLGRTGLTVHGFRSAFADWAAEQTSFQHEVREMALAHKVGDAVVQAYRRTDQFQKRRELAEAWSRYCSAPAEDNVTPIGRRAAHA